MLVAVIRQQVDVVAASRNSNKKVECELLLQCKSDEPQSSTLSIAKVPGDHSKQSKCTKKRIALQHVHQIINSAGGFPGFKAKRIVHAKTQTLPVNDKAQEISLYIMPVYAKQDMEAVVRFQSTSPQTCEFVLLHKAMHEVNTHPGYYDAETKLMVELVNRWFKKQCSKPNSLTALFRPSALERIHDNVTNPAYAKVQSQGWFLLENKLTAEEVMHKMKEANKPDMHIVNPMFGVETSPFNKVDCHVTNPYFGKETPRYEDIKVPDADQWSQGDQNSDEKPELSWVEEFPVHRAAGDGDLTTLQQLLQTDCRRAETWDHAGWAPIHYACWHGRVDAVLLLLDEWLCDPNFCNKNKTSLLHLAAGCGHSQIVKILCDHPFIDRHIKDKQNRTVMECCEQIRSKDWLKCMQHLKELAHKPYQKVVIHKMDGSEKLLELKQGSNTSVIDVMQNLQLSSDARQYFALWITSNSLHLQLKPDHSLLQEIRQWPEILVCLGGANQETCQNEKPRIVLKRDACLLPNIEEKVTDISSIRLLYEEARAQVIRGLYPCTDEVAIAMGSIVMRILHGPFDQKKHKTSYFSDEVLLQVMQTSMLRRRLEGWLPKLLAQYKEISEQGPGEISQLQLLYLRYCWTQIPAYGSAFFTGYAFATRFVGSERIQRIVPLYIGVNHRGIHFIKVEKKALLVSLSYHSLTWRLSEEEKLFQIQTGDKKINMVIHTPQSRTICYLMSKLCNV